jgi:hypothetical protein
MAFPTQTITVDNVSASTADPSLARADIYSAFQALNTIISEANGANGVLILDSSGKITSTQVPNNLATSGTLSLTPATNRVEITDVLNLSPITTAQAEDKTSQEGDVAYISDGDGGDACFAVFDGTDWLRISLGSAISAT